jgi:prepilin-type N-terminal cleavage/methylation domain-containing protein
MTMPPGRRGFTIIELIATVAIIGLLASIAILKTRQSQDKAIRASMLVDLKTLVSAQEGFFSANKDYAGGIAGTEVVGTKGKGRAALGASNGNAITVRYRGPDGWSARATNTRLTGKPKTCGVFIGPIGYSPNAAVKQEGVPVCY